MPPLNPAYRKCRIERRASYDHALETRARQQFRENWNKLNYSDFSDQSARQTIIEMVKPAADPYRANQIVTSVRLINALTDLNLSLEYSGYLDQTLDVVQEISLHRMASCEPPYVFPSAVAKAYGYIPEKFNALYLAVLQDRYHPNPTWLEAIHKFTRELLVDISVELTNQMESAPEKKQKAVESALVAAAIAESQYTFELVFFIVGQDFPELAQRLEHDRQAFLGRYAYHFTREDLMEKIAEKGLSAQFAPEGSEQPEALFFNNAKYAGIDHARVGITGFYVKDYLLRIPLEAAPFQAGRRTPDQNLGDYACDYFLDKKHIIPPEKIEIVDPVISTRAIPLIGA